MTGSQTSAPATSQPAGKGAGPILIACSDSPGAGAALALGRLLAKALETMPIGAHVLPQPDYMLGDDPGLMFERRAERVASHVDAELAPLGGRALIIQSHSVAEGLLELTRRHGAAAIVLGCNSSGSLPGATTRSLLRHAKCSVSLAPPGFEDPDDERVFTIAVASKSAGRGPAVDLAVRLRRTQRLSVILDPPETGETQSDRRRPWRGRSAFASLDQLLDKAQAEPDLVIAATSRRHRSLLWLPGIPGSRLLRRRRFALVLVAS